MRTKEQIEENERRIMALWMMVQANGGNCSAYARKIGIKRCSIQNMLSGTMRVTDKALGGGTHGEDQNDKA